MGPSSSRTGGGPPQPPFDGVCCPHLPAPVGCGISEAGREAVGVVAQAFDSLRVGIPPAVGEAAAVESGDGGVQYPGDAADGRGQDRAPEQWRKDLADPAGGQAQHEAGEDDPVDPGARRAQLPSTAVGR